MAEGHTLTVAEVVAETEDARSFVLDVPPEHAEAFEYRPGQFLTLQVGTAARCYSLSSAPHEGDRLTVTVKRTEGGYGSNWLCDNLDPGDLVRVLPPSGLFTPPSFERDLLLFAGGSGITPIMSILKTAMHRGTGRVVLVYANRDERSVIFRAGLAELSRQYADRLTVLHWLQTLQGMPTVEQLRGLAMPYTSHEAFLCGPEPYMAAVKQSLKDLGVDRERIHLERFSSLERSPFEAAPDTEPEVAGEEGTTDLTVDLDGTKHEFSWPRNQKLLSFLLQQGLDAPYSCQEGRCSACACRIVDGEVRMLNNEILDDDDLADGIVLACQSKPVTDQVSISYE